MRRDYEDDTRMDWPEGGAGTASAGSPGRKGFRPWLARMLGRSRPAP